jgi:hypothetical protein
MPLRSLVIRYRPGSNRIKISATYLGTTLGFTGDSIDYNNDSTRGEVQPVATYSSTQGVELASDEETYYRDFYRSEGIANGLSGTALDSYVESAISTLEQSRTAQYHNLHDSFDIYARGGYSAGDLTRKQVKSFAYTPTASESEGLTSSIKIWKEEELLYSFSAGLGRQ